MKIQIRTLGLLISLVLFISTSCSPEKGTDGKTFDADGSLIHYDEFNTIIGDVGVGKEIDPAKDKHIVFSFKGEGVYGPRISLLENNTELNQKDYNLVHIKFKIEPEKNMPLTWHLRFENEGSPDVSTSIKLFDYIAPDKDKNGCYDCQIPLSYFQCPTESITHAQLFCNDYGSREDVLNVDFDLHFLAFKKVRNIHLYNADFGVPKLDKNINKRIREIHETEFRGDESKGNGNDTRAGEGYSGQELFAMQKELRLLIHENLDKAPLERELEILELLRYGKPDREISHLDVQKKISAKASKRNHEVELFYDGYAVYDYIRKYRATGDLRYFECALVQADYVMTDPHSKVSDKDRMISFARNNGTLGLGRGFSGICEAILEIKKTPELQNTIAPSLYGNSRTYLELADLWLSHMIAIIDEFNGISGYENGKWTEGDGIAINRFLYYTHFLLAASESARISGNPDYIPWSQATKQQVKDILQFFQGDCLLTNESLMASKRNNMSWDPSKEVFISEYGPYVIWAYAYPRSNTEDFAHIQMDMEAIDSILELDGSLLSEDFKKKMATMLFIATFNTSTGGMQRDICPGVPGLPPANVPPWHTHYVHEYGRYIGKYCIDKAYDEFLSYQLLVWDQQLINGNLGRFSQYPMPREIVEARLFKYKPS